MKEKWAKGKQCKRETQANGPLAYTHEETAIILYTFISVHNPVYQPVKHESTVAAFNKQTLNQHTKRIRITSLTRAVHTGARNVFEVVHTQLNALCAIALTKKEKKKKEGEKSIEKTNCQHTRIDTRMQMYRCCKAAVARQKR